MRIVKGVSDSTSSRLLRVCMMGTGSSLAMVTDGRFQDVVKEKEVVSSRSQDIIRALMHLQSPYFYLGEIPAFFN